MGAKTPGHTKADEGPSFTLRGRKIPIRHSSALIVNLARARDLGQPVIFQDAQEKLNEEQTDPEDVQRILEEAVDLLKLWLDQVRNRRTDVN